MIKVILLVVSIIVSSCGVKNDVIPPEEPWIIFEVPKNNKKNLKKKKESKNVVE